MVATNSQNQFPPSSQDSITSSKSNSSRLSALSASLSTNPNDPNQSNLVASLPASNVPSLFTTRPIIPSDKPASQTTRDQAETVTSVLPYLTGTTDGVRPQFNEAGVPPLLRQAHAEFARDTMEEKMPGAYVGYDAARPWIVYWGTTALGVLGELDGGESEGRGEGELSRERRRLANRSLRDKAMDTFAAQQVPTGGFGGSHGHLAHLAPTYAAVLSLAMLSGTSSSDPADTTDPLGIIDRKALWEWLGEVKQADGGFRVCVDGEEDVRGAYCALTILTLLNLPLTLPPHCPARTKYGMISFTDGLKGWLRRCQTYEGGISGNPDSEAHGAYAFCVLGCLSLLGDPRITIPEVLNVDLLVSWLSSRQYAPEGGFSGRTNKLVDACYSHWVGGCWPLLEAAAFGTKGSVFSQSSQTSLYNREGLIRYILCCCQGDDGGLRDKPGKFADGYHTCYTLAGLSSALHYNEFELLESGERELPAAFGWTSKGRSNAWRVAGDEGSVQPIHPVFVVPFEAVERAKIRFEGQRAAWR